MNITKISIALFITIFALLLNACGGNNQNFDKEVAVVVALTQTAMAMDNPPPTPATTEAAPTAEPTGDYQPISEQECSDLNALLSQQTGIAGAVTNPAPFDDYVNETSGFGCAISLTTTRADEKSNQLWGAASEALGADGWVEDMMYGAGGIGGSIGAYRKGDQLCLTASYVGPIDKSLCPEGEGYFNCVQNLPPEQIRYGFDANCARPVR